MDRDDPYELLSNNSTCPYCGVSDPDFCYSEKLKEHYKNACQVMTQCRFCAKVILVSNLSDHYIRRCPFLLGTMIACPKCGIAIDKDDKDGHPMCRGHPPPAKAQWCPLCIVAVRDSVEDWKSHLVSSCKNAREKPYTHTKSKRGTHPNNKASLRNTSAPRLIDADKLVAALQDVQLRKKMQDKKKTAKDQHMKVEEP